MARPYERVALSLLAERLLDRSHSASAVARDGDEMSPMQGEAETATHQSANTPQRPRWRRRMWLLAVPLVVAVVAATVVAWRLESWVRSAVDKRLAPHGFSVVWQEFSSSPLGRVRVSGIVLRERSETLLQVQRVEAKLSWPDLLLGRIRLASLQIEQPEVQAVWHEGQGGAWQRLREALQPTKRRQASQRTLADRIGVIEVRRGRLTVQVLGKPVWVVGPRVDVSNLNVVIDTRTGGSGSVSVPQQAGGGEAKITVACEAGQLSHVEVNFADATHFVPPVLLAARLPAGLDLRWRKAAWRAHQGVSIHGLQVVDLAAGQTEVGHIDSVAATADGGEIRGVAVRVAKSRWQEAVAHFLPQGLPSALTPVAAAAEVVAADASQIVVRREDKTTRVTVRDLRMGVLDGAVSCAHADIRLGEANSGGDRAIDVEADHPLLRLGRQSVLLQVAHVTPVMETMLTLRKAAPAPSVAEAQDEEPDPEDDRVAPPSGAKERPTPPPPTDPQRPPQRWRTQLKHAHRQLLGLHTMLEKLWPRTPRAEGLHLAVRHAGLEVVDVDGRVLLGVRNGVVRWQGSGVPLEVAFEPYDRAGGWGRFAFTWQRQREAALHRIGIALSGSGIAQLLGSQLPGSSVGDGAHVAVRADLRVPDATQFDIEGHVDVQNMGIHWWRLADRPIADFALSLPFRFRASPTALSLHAPDVYLGDAHMNGMVELLDLDADPRVHLRVDAPMQDCGAMLASVPPSMSPTIGKIEAHGAIGWHVDISTKLPQISATSVDLALHDTTCVVDRLGDIDLAFFTQPNWSRPVNENGKILDNVKIGPGSGSWMSMKAMPRYLPFVMYATEDSFFSHRGISEELVAKALAIDLSAGRFVYGGSTVTQQLVKNLFLKRTKALSRKFEEMIIAWQMEKIVGKQRILEIYINGVEFGPKIYGIRRAAWAYFQKTPDQLSPKEATFLAIIKPSPPSGWGAMRTNAWNAWFERKSGHYMQYMVDKGYITQQQYEAEKPWQPVFCPPGRACSTPKQPVTP